MPIEKITQDVVQIVYFTTLGVEQFSPMQFAGHLDGGVLDSRTEKRCKESTCPLLSLGQSHGCSTQSSSLF